MTLIQLLEIISDSSEVVIYRNGDEIARYNGKDSIPEELNNEKVNTMWAERGYFSDIPHIAIDLRDDLYYANDWLV